MSISDELQKLGELHRDGTLSRDEFEIAKRKILGEPQTATDLGSDQLAEIKSQNEITQLDRQWELERENYMIAGRYGNKYIPRKISSVLGGVAIVGFGIFWTASANSMQGFESNDVFSLFPLFGVLFIVFGVVMSIVSFTKAIQYENAYRNYQRRRSELQKEN